MKGLNTIIGDALKEKTGNRCPFDLTPSDSEKKALHEFSEEAILYWGGNKELLKKTTKESWGKKEEKKRKEEKEAKQKTSTFHTSCFTSHINTALTQSLVTLYNEKERDQYFNRYIKTLTNAKMGTNAVIKNILRLINEFHEEHGKYPTSEEIKSNKLLAQNPIGLAWSPREISGEILSIIESSKKIKIFSFIPSGKTELSGEFTQKAKTTVEEAKIDKNNSLCGGKKEIASFTKTVTEIFLVMYEDIQAKYKNPIFIYD